MTLYFLTDIFDSAEYNLSLLPETKKISILSMKSKERRDISLSAYLLLSYAIKKEKGVSSFNLLVEKKGKPYIEGNPFYFNYSHTKKAIICVVCDTPVGIDLEVPRPFSESVALRVCSRNELDALNSSDDKDALFCKMWVQKEAYSKYTGNGFSEGFNTIETLDSDMTFVLSKSPYFIGIAGIFDDTDFFVNSVSSEMLLINGSN